MSRRIKILLVFLPFVLAIVGSLNPALAQTIPMSVDVVVDPPYSQYVSEWQRNPSRVLMMIDSADLIPVDPEASFSVYLAGSMESLNLSPNVRIESKFDYRPLVPIVISGLELEGGYQVTTASIRQLFDFDNLDFVGITEEELTASSARGGSGAVFPEGTYEICTRVLDYETGRVLGDRGCSNSFRIDIISPPVPFIPTCSGGEAALIGGEVSFRWQMEADVAFELQYLFELTDVPTGVDPEQAIEASARSEKLEATIDGVTEFNYGEDPGNFTRLPLVSGQRYAWRVTASSPTEPMNLRNGGVSRTCTFVMGAYEDLAVELISPDTGASSEYHAEGPEFSWTVNGWGGSAVPVELDYTLRLALLAESTSDPEIALRGAEVAEVSTSSRRQTVQQRAGGFLVPGSHYAWEVVASDPNGVFTFDNDGRSESRTFTYGGIAAPRLIRPAVEDVITEAATLEWGPVMLPTGSEAEYQVRVVRIDRSASPNPDLASSTPLGSPDLIANERVTGTSFPLPASLVSGDQYVWQVTALDPTGAFAASRFQNDGRSEMWWFNFGSGGETGTEGDPTLTLVYPADRYVIMDQQPPFLVSHLLNPSDQTIELTIEEVSVPEGSPRGPLTRTISGASFTEACPLLLLNSYGSSSGPCALQTPQVSDTYQTTPGGTYRWNISSTPTSGGTSRSASGSFSAAPTAQLLAPTEGASVTVADEFSFQVPWAMSDGTLAEMRILDQDDIPNFVPGAGHPFQMFIVVQDPDGATTYFTSDPIPLSMPPDRDPRNPAAVAPFSHTLEIPSFPTRPSYRWRVETRIGDVVVAASPYSTFTTTGQCIAVNASMPPNRGTIPILGVPRRDAEDLPEGEDPPEDEPVVGSLDEWLLSFTPKIDVTKIGSSTIRVYEQDSDLSTPDELVFTGTFSGGTDRSPTGTDTGRITVAEVEPRNASGEAMTLEQDKRYRWETDVNFDTSSGPFRTDGVACGVGTASGEFTFSTDPPPREIPSCVTITDNDSVRPSAIPETVTITGYTMTIDRGVSTLAADGRLSGQGVVSVGSSMLAGGWAVEFTDLYLNRSNQVIRGTATVRTRDAFPSALSGLLSNNAVPSGTDVNRLAQAWFGEAQSLLEIVTGDRMVPFGFDIAMADFNLDSDVGFKAGIATVTFEPQRAYYDAIVAVRMPIDTNAGPSTQILGLYGQGLTLCAAEGLRYRYAFRYAGDTAFGSPDFNDYEFVVKGSPVETITDGYVMGPGDGTGVVLSERGFEQLHIELGLGIPRSQLIPLVESTPGNWTDVPTGRVQVTAVFDVKKSGAVSGDADTDATRSEGSGFYLTTNVPKSRISGKNWNIAAERVTLDLSTSWSPTPGSGTSVPLGFGAIPTSHTSASLPASWKGLYIGEATVEAPGLGFPIGVQDARFGSPLSFTAFAEPMVERTIGDGAMTVRLDQIDIRMVDGNFERARILASSTFPGAMEGRVNLELMYLSIPEDASAEERRPENAFVINLSAPEDEKFKITDFMRFQIDEGSNIALAYAWPAPPGKSAWNFGFDISGELEFFKENAAGEDKISIGGVEFEHFVFDSGGKGLQPPERIVAFGSTVYERDSGSSASSSDSGESGGGGGSTASETPSTGDGNQRVGRFPIGIEGIGIGFGADGSSMYIEPTLYIALTGDEGLAIGGSTTIRLDGVLAMVDGDFKWQAPDISVQGVSVYFESEAFSIAGEVRFYEDDPTYGDGFDGRLQVGIAKMFDAEARILFGAMPSYRYWYVDASVTSGVPIVALGPMGVYGFRGGAYQHIEARETRDGDGIVTDVTFVPTAEPTFAVMAGVHLGVVGEPSSFNAKVLFSAVFDGEGLDRLSLEGQGRFMCELTDACNGPDDSVVGVSIVMSMDEPMFHASANGRIMLDPIVTVNAPVGSIDILFSPTTWHIYVGQGPLKSGKTLSASFFPAIAGGITAELYVQIGDGIQVRLPGGRMITGSGFATGVGVEVSAGGKFLIFYGEVYGRLSAELALIVVAEDLRDCFGSANGWFMTAKVNLELGLAVGIDVDLWFVSGRFEIFSAEIAIGLDIGGPNPTYFDGEAAARFRILGGLIKGRFHYKFHAGDDIDPVCMAALNDAYALPEPIISVAPDDGATDVSVFSSIGLGYALEEGRSFFVKLSEPDSTRIRFRLEAFTVSDRAGRPIPGSRRNVDDNMGSEWIAVDVLPGRSELTARAVAVGEKYVDGRWQELRRQDSTWTFTTGQAPRDFYNAQARDIQYPLENQRYSYVDGHEGKHYVHLTYTMKYLLGNLKENESLIARYEDDRGVTTDVPLVYDMLGVCGALVSIEDPPIEAFRRYRVKLIKRTQIMRIDQSIALMLYIPMGEKSDEETGPGGIDTMSPMVTGAQGVGALGPPGGIELNGTNMGRIQVPAHTASSDATIPRVNGGISGDDLLANSREIYGGTYLDRYEGVARSRLIDRDVFVDTTLYDWYLRVGRHNNAQEKLAATRLEFIGMFGTIPFGKIVTPEPFDDDFTSMVFIRNQRHAARGGEVWLYGVDNFDKHGGDWNRARRSITPTDRLSLGAFRYTMSASDKSQVLEMVEGRLMRSSIRRPMNYVNAYSSINFSRANAASHRLAAWETTFDQRNRSSSDSGFLGTISGMGGIGGIGSAGIGTSGGESASSGLNLPLAPPEDHEVSFIIDNAVAKRDWNSTRWRYNNLASSTMNVTLESLTSEIRTLGLPSSYWLTARTINYIRAVGAMPWREMSRGNYSIGIVQKSIGWRLASLLDRSYDRRRLDEMSVTASARYTDEFQCVASDPVLVIKPIVIQ